jgi:hypothetical protein
MKTNDLFFLAKNKKITGPFESEEIESLRLCGQISAYTWLWKQGDDHWTPIDPPPAIPTTHASSGISSAGKSDLASILSPSSSAETKHPYHQPDQGPTPPPFRPQQRPPALRNVSPEAYRVILFDHQNAVSGWLLSAHEGGCEIRSDQDGADPLFVQKSTACLSLHDTRSGDALKVNVRLSAVQRTDGAWSYRLRWNALPALEDLLQVS